MQIGEQSINKRVAEQAGVLDEFQTELIGAWPRLPNKAFFFSLLAGWLLLFQFFGNSTFGYYDTPSIFQWMFNTYNNPASHGDDVVGNFIPFLVLGLFWWKREQLLAGPIQTWAPALGIVAAAALLHGLAYAVQQPLISIVALFIGIYGLMGLAWGWPWLKRSLFPFALFVFSVPIASHASFITVPLALLVSRLVELVSQNLLGIDVIRHGNLLFDPTGKYQYEVAAACSGIRSLTMVFLLSTVYGFVVFRSPWKRIVMVALGLPLAIIGNLTRMLFIIVAASIGGQAAGDKVHDGGPMGFYSLIPYVPALLGVIWVGRKLEDLERSPESEPKGLK